MVPNADMNRTEAAMINTYMFSNMTPQHDNFNRRIWAYLEKYARALAKIKGELYIVTGSILDKDSDGARDEDVDADRVDPRDRVAIPTHFYKIFLYQRSNGFIDTMTFLLPHTDEKITGAVKSDTYLTQHLTTIDTIESITGMDFFSVLPDFKETAVENFQANTLWSSFP
jgi:endonuclease G